MSPVIKFSKAPRANNDDDESAPGKARFGGTGERM
jgi:hypothetical protein